jgi:hypothetical protein
MMLGQSPDQNYSWHADEAVKLYENMYDADETPSPEQAEGIKDLLEDAKRVQANARADNERFEASLPTEQEEREWKEEQVRAADEEFQNGEPEIENDDDFHDDMLSDVSDEAEVHHGDPEETAPPAIAEGVEGVEDVKDAEDAVEVGEVKDVEMAQEQSVAQPAAEDAGGVQGAKKRSTISAVDREIVTQGLGASSNAVSRTDSGNPGGASRRSSRRKSGN